MHPPIPAPHEIEEALEALAAGEPVNTAWLAALIDHTLLKPGVGEPELRKLCEEARAHHFATVCVRPEHVEFCVKQLQGSGVKTIAVVGFPSVDTPTAQKEADTQRCRAAGAAEIDMVLAVPLLRQREHAAVLADIRAVVAAAGSAPVKVILETCLLDAEEKGMACALAKAAGAAFVKTSTGFSTGGANLEDVALMRRAVGHEFGVKASGGVRSQEDALRMVLAGANRLGTSAGVALVTGNLPGAPAKGVY